MRGAGKRAGLKTAGRPGTAKPRARPSRTDRRMRHYTAGVKGSLRPKVPSRRQSLVPAEFRLLLMEAFPIIALSAQQEALHENDGDSSVGSFHGPGGVEFDLGKIRRLK